MNPPSCKMATFLVGYWLLVYQFIEISNQMAKFQAKGLHDPPVYGVKLYKLASFD